MLTHILSNSLAASSVTTYRRALTLLSKFSTINFPSQLYLPTSSALLANFIGYLYTQNLAPSTILTYISAISFINKIQGFPDPGRSFIVKKLIVGIQREKSCPDARLPITTSILHTLLHHVHLAVHLSYDIFLYKAIFLIAFHGFFRMGELIPRNIDYFHKVVQMADVSFCRKEDKILSCTIKLNYWKGNITKRLAGIEISAIQPANICPVGNLVAFLSVRGSVPGPLFCKANGSPCSRHELSNVLNNTLRFSALDVSRFKGHSFRIGAATSAAAAGCSDAEIQTFGRWKSSAYKKYIRINPHF